MAVGTVATIMARIKKAEPTSPIAVFKMTRDEVIINEEVQRQLKIKAKYKKKEGRDGRNSVGPGEKLAGARLVAIFANTFECRKRIADGDQNFIGIFHKESNLTETRKYLTKIERRHLCQTN